MPGSTKWISVRRDLDGAVDLSKRRQWFSDDMQESDNDNPQDGQDAPTSIDPARKRVEDMSIEELRAGLIEVRGESKERRINNRTTKQELEQARAELEAYRKLEKEHLKKQNNFEELARRQETELAELASLKAEAQRYRESVEASNAQRIARLPEHYKDIVPDLPPDAKSAWLDVAVGKLTAPPVPNLDGGAGGVSGRGPAPKVTDLDKDSSSLASAYGYEIDADKLAARREEIENRKTKK
jgi:hypothetical protein